jgi:hypothetical protein
MRRITLIIGIVILATGVYAQGQRQGYLEVRQDPALDSLLMSYEMLRAQVELNTDNKGIPGYRIQIFFDSGINSGERARKAMEGFELLFPDIPGYITWKAPNYRVRVGDFRSRLEAEKALAEIEDEYPNAWVIKDEINYPPLFTKKTEE